MLMMSTGNIFSPQNGSPIIGPNQDIVLGCFWLTLEAEGEKGEGMVFSSREEVITAYQTGHLGIHARIRVRMPEAIAWSRSRLVATLWNAISRSSVSISIISKMPSRPL